MKKTLIFTLLLTFAAGSLFTGCVAVTDPDPEVRVVDPVDTQVTATRRTTTYDPVYGQATTTATTRTAVY